MDGFTSLQELYKRVEPALNCKIKDLNRVGIHYIKCEDVWNYLRLTRWSKRNNLTLGEVVNDIMTVTNSELETYVHSLIRKEKREIIQDYVL